MKVRLPIAITKSWQFSVAVLISVVALLGLTVFWIEKPLIVWLLGTLILIGLSILSMLWRMERQVPPFWSVFQKKVVASLHHPHPESAELDTYLEELESLTISDSRRSELVALLEAKRDNPNESSDERERAEILLFAMPRVVKEREDAAHVARIIGSKK